MGDPISGSLGELVMSGWVAAAPTGYDEAYLLLTTPDPRAPTTMAAVADVLGLVVGQIAETGVAHVEITSGWAELVVAGQRFSRPVNSMWEATARERGQVVLAVGTAPRPAGMDEDTYTGRHGDEVAIGIVQIEPRSPG